MGAAPSSSDSFVVSTITIGTISKEIYQTANYWLFMKWKIMRLSALNNKQKINSNDEITLVDRFLPL